MGWPLLLASAAAWYFADWHWSLIPAALLLFVLYFFRDPHRAISVGDHLLVSPADGTVVEVTRLERDEFVGGPAVRIGIFLSIFNVHLNRAPAAARVIALRYLPGRFLNAMRPESATQNEAMWIGLESESPPHRRIVVRQIAGLIARKIVCPLRPGEVLAQGQRIGMIKFGSRTELILPDEPGLEIAVKPGDAVRGGSDVLARYNPPAT
jgi:phosphatidylserine decarboxylase